MSNPAFIVDGFTEKLILEEICPGKPVRRTDLNGKSVSIEAIANKINSLIRLLNNRYYPIIIVIDREERVEDCETIERILTEELNKKGLSGHDLRISVADRMLENWIVADWKLIAKTKPKPKETDGLKGTSIIKKHFGQYGKTTDGVELFKKANPSIQYKYSPSYRKFINNLRDLDCSYLQLIK